MLRTNYRLTAATSCFIAYLVHQPFKYIILCAIMQAFFEICSAFQIENFHKSILRFLVIITNLILGIYSGLIYGLYYI